MTSFAEPSGKSFALHISLRENVFRLKIFQGSIFRNILFQTSRNFKLALRQKRSFERNISILVQF
jgi:hypothetical protein